MKIKEKHNVFVAMVSEICKEFNAVLEIKALQHS
jgi:hypothetical protein